MKKPEILELRPTQFVLGMKEIQFKVKKIRAFSKKQLIEYCDAHVIPVILGPGKESYLIDHHHFARACWETGVTQYKIQIFKDLRTLEVKKFWEVMEKNHWTYLFDQFGTGPRTPLALPSDIRGLADDPYRSLAWAVLNEGSIQKVNVPFFEFQWAAYFRRHLKLVLHSKSDFSEAIEKGIALAKAPKARHLPGFIRPA